MLVGIIVLFIVIFICVLAFKKDVTKTTVTRKDENGNEISETHVTEHHSAGQTAARIVVGIIIAVFVLFALIVCASLSA